MSRTVPLALALFLPAVMGAQTYSGPKCLGPYCLGQSVSAQSFVNQIETPGKKPPVTFWMFSAVYKSKDGKACLDLTENPFSPDDLASISLRETPDCPGDLSKEDLSTWKTKEGVGLGSSEEDVLRVYKEQSAEKEAAWGYPGPCSGTNLISYRGILNGSNRAARFGIRQGKVSCISFSNLEYSGPECLGPICRTHSQPTPSLLAQLGLPKGQRPISGSYCFRSRSEQTFLSLWKGRNYDWGPDEVEVVLADFRNCMHMPENFSASDFHGWVTPEGIRLGSSEGDVMKAYGKPAREQKMDAQMAQERITGFQGGDKLPSIGEKSFTYHGIHGIGRAEFGIREGRVSYIWFSGHQ